MPVNFNSKSKLNQRTVFYLIVSFVVIVFLFSAFFPCRDFIEFLSRERPFLNLRYDLIILGIISGIIIFFSPKFFKRKRSILTVWIILLSSLLLNIALYRPYDYSLNFRLLATLSPHINPFFDKGAEMENLEEYFLKHSEKIERGYIERISSTYPPGLPVFYYFLFKIVRKFNFIRGLVSLIDFSSFTNIPNFNSFDLKRGEIGLDYIDAAVISTLLNFIIFGVVMILAYMITLELAGYKAAIRSIQLLAIVPSMHLYIHSSDIILIPLSLLSIFSLLVGIKKNQLIAVISAGGIISCGLFLSYSFMPVIFFSIFFLLFSCKHGRKISTLLFYLIGLVGVILFFFFIFGINLFTIFFYAMENNQQFYSMSNRTYFMSIPSNIIEVFIFTGIVGPLLLLILVSNKISNSTFPRRNFWAFSRRANFIIIYVLTIILLIISGGVRGEASRNCLAIIPLMCIASASNMSSFYEKYYLLIWWSGFFIFVLICLLIETQFSFWVLLF